MNSAIVYSVFIMIYLLLMWKAGKSFPILYLFLLTYFLQYVLSTYLIYNEYDVLSYQMPINQEQYFAYVIPALIFLFGGLFLFNKEIEINVYVRKIDSSNAAQLGYLLLFISVFFDVVKWFGFSSIDSIINFTTYLKYLAAFCFLFTRSIFNYILIGLIYMQLAIIVLRSGVFVSFFIWTIFLILFFVMRYSIPYAIRLLFFIVLVSVVVVIQGVKGDYREQIRRNDQKSGVNLLTDLSEKQNRKESNLQFSKSSGVIATVGRLTQGWHLGLILKRVPKKEPIANGNEMLGDIMASFLPRLLFSDKQSVNSQDKFYKYTGHKLLGSTSMSVGLLGDFYLNFGRWGSFIMLFIFGVIMAKLLQFFIVRYVLPDPINIIWVPFILSYLIRANNDFYIFFNCMVKGFLIFLAVNYIRYHFLGARKPHPFAKPVAT